MSARRLAEAILLLRDAFPRQPLGDRSLRLYGEQLADLDADAVVDAIDVHIKVGERCPTIGEIRRTVIEMTCRIPTAEEAWEAALAGDLSDETVAATTKAVGGRWMLLHTENPETLRAQFRRHYEGRRETRVRTLAAGRPIEAWQLKDRTPPALPAPVSLNGRRVEQLPESTRIRPRPVMWRLMQRLSGRQVGPPTDEEKADAILLLRDGPVGGPEDSLWQEAERVMVDAHNLLR